MLERINQRHGAMKTVLFLCSGNYYRSRFAEYLFNRLAENGHLPWRAASRGLTVGLAGNIGPISPLAVDGLKLRNIRLNGDVRLPQQVVEAELAHADLVVAVKEAEHRPAMDKLFPRWADRIHYWHIDDLDCAAAEEALALLEDRVRALVVSLANGAA